MPDEVLEMFDSRSVDLIDTGRKITRKFEVSNSDPEQAINSLPAFDDPHPTLPTLHVTSVSTSPKPDDDEVCLGTVIYGEDENDPRENEYGEVWEWGLGADQVHITSVKTAAMQLHYPAAYDVGTAVGLDSEEVHGVDVYRPAISLKVTKRFASMNPGARRTIVNLTSHVNGGYWSRENYSPRQVLFLGANVSPQKRGAFLVEYNFLIGNEPDTTLVDLADGGSVVITPNPWDYIWFKHVSRMIDSGGGVMTKKTLIESIHIAKVYPEGQFGNLNLKGP
jgi:hypothetical protein